MARLKMSIPGSPIQPLLGISLILSNVFAISIGSPKIILGLGIASSSSSSQPKKTCLNVSLRPITIEEHNRKIRLSL
jgi:hypothetical protein